MSPAALAAIEARVRIASGAVHDWQVDAAIGRVATEDAPALLAHIRRLEAEREAEIAAAVASARALEQAIAEYDAETADVPLGAESRSLGRSVYNWRRAVVRAIREKAAAIREPKP